MNCERTFRLSDIIAGLSYALDLTEGQPPGHAQRTCLIGMRLAEPLRLGEDDATALFYALLLKDAGCSSNAARMTALFGGDDRVLKRRSKTVDWTRPSEALRFTAASVAPGESPLGRARAFLSAAAELAAQGREMIDARCDRGARIVAMLGFPPAAADTVRTLDERWDGRGLPARLKGDEIPLMGRIASLSQAAEVFFTRGGIEAARDMVRARRGRWFDPELGDVFLSIGDADPLWARLAAESGPGLAPADAPDERTLAVDDDRLDQMARAFAQVIDAKSPFTARHSTEVARYAGVIARRLGYDATGSARPASRGAAARHRQARHLQHHPRQGGRPDRRRGQRGHGSTRATRWRSCLAWSPSRPLQQAPRRTTSGATGAGTTWDSRGRRFRPPRGSWRSPMSTRR